MKISFTSLVFKEKSMHVAYCPELDVSSCGRSVDEARRNLLEAVNLFIEETRGLGTLEDILREVGYTPASGSSDTWNSPDLILTERREINLPSGG